VPRVAKKSTMPYDHGGIVQITEVDRPARFMSASTLASPTLLPDPSHQGRFHRVLS